MKRIKTIVTYKVPDWEYCNHSSLGQPTKDKCRFCVKQGKAYVCALHNVPLNVEEGVLVAKHRACVHATFGARVEVTDNEDIQVDPKAVMKLTMKEYRKAYSKLIKQGYPDAMADKLAQQAVTGGV